jgi:hypothetical protein
MSRPAAAIVNTAQSVASYLDGISERKRANDVRRLCRSNVGIRTHLVALQHDNMQLRARVAELEAKNV